MEDTKALEEYFRSSIEKRLAGANLQDAEVVYETPATRLLEKRKEMADIDQSLAAQNEEFHLKVESVKNRRNELRRKENLLKESLVKFDKFLRENDGKRTRAVKKAQDERRVRDAKEQEIVQTRALVVELMAKRERQAKAMRSNSRFQHFLETAVEASGGEFAEIHDVIARHDTLLASNCDLKERAAAVLEQSESERNAFQLKNEEMNSEVLNYANQLARKQTHLEEVRARSLQYQLEWDRILSSVTQKSLVLGKIKMSTNNLFNMVKSRANSHLLNVTDPLEQIEKVGTFAFELSVVVDELEKMMREENLSRSMTSSTAAAAKSQADTATPQGKTVHRGNNSTRSLVSTSNALSDGIRSTASSVKSSRQSLPLGSKAMINGQQSRSVNASRAMLLSRTEL